MPLSDQQSFILFNNEANFALLDTDPGASNGNGLYEQLVYIHDGYGTGWNEFHPIFLPNGNHNDWAAGGVGSDTLVGDSAGDLSTQSTGVDTIDGYRPSNDVLYGGDGWYLDYDDDIQSVIAARDPLPTDDGPEDSTCPAFDNFDFGDFDINDFDLSNFHDFGLSPRFDFAGDWLVGGRDNDTLFGQFGHDTLEGGEGRDWMFGGRDNDLMDGHYLEDSPWAQTMSDAGDVMFGGRGKDTMYGGDDNQEQWLYKDWYTFTGSAGQVCLGYFPIWNYDGDWMSGGGGRDTMYGENGFDTMYGDACIDKMYGGEHYDLMYGGRGSDIMAGGDYFDTADSGTGGEVWGQDYVEPMGYCEDRCAYEGNFDAQGLWPRGGDTMYGGRGNDEMSGGAGDDLMFGGYGHDLMYGNLDDDRMLGENGSDTMYGGDGWDDMSGGNGADSMFGGNGSDYMAGDNGDDYMSGGNHDDLMRGGNGADEMYGDDGYDTMYGDAGTDLMFGGEGNDCMHGGTERDTMYGGDGDDKIDGGNDTGDRMYGGDGDDIIWIGGGTANLYEEAYGDAGMDTFVYNFSFDEANNAANGDSGWVYIGDFTQGEDVLQLCFDDLVTFCCDDVDHTDPADGVTAANWDYYNDNLLRALSVPDIDGQHAVKVVDNGDYTLIMFDSTDYAYGQDAKDPEAEDASDPQIFTDAVIWLEGVTGGERPFATLWDLHQAGYRVEISHPDYYDYAKTVSGDQYGEGEWTYASCQIDCGCDIDPFALPICEDQPGEVDETAIA